MKGVDWPRRHPHRFVLERMAMDRHFPSFHFFDQDPPFWAGVLRVAPFRRDFKVAVVYTPGYPDREPAVHCLEPRLPERTPHRFADGSLCVHPEDAPPETFTPAVSVALCQAWLFMYCDWERTGRPW